ncbi:hypothetical protein B5F29_13535 [Lachnoclostridium sp. An196]|uniref:zinc ribbon domain-containing protein n=1 Tax=Lachnoclostridium sp. An196 TaxID=1965583 RepID=UPI000B393F54|nr:zinc ribbon domain-containing protein [Lachnoclostridium sp. An196]OUP17613.1 hypothetical protein B5F29_13535 [Lachnoclostridium sp. An196]
MFCSNCGTQNSDGAVFCKNCGFSLEEGLVKETEKEIPDSQQPVSLEQKASTYAGPQNNVLVSQANAYTQSSVGDNDASASKNQNAIYKPIGMWGYFGLQILFGIPLIGFIFLLVFAFGGTKNINVRNFARSYFCVLILWIVLILLFFTIGPGRALLDILLYNLRYL